MNTTAQTTGQQLADIIRHPERSVKAYAGMIVSWVVAYLSEYGIEVPSDIQTDAGNVVGFVLLSVLAFFGVWIPTNRDE